MLETSHGILVYGDSSRIVVLGRVHSQSDAMKLLDGYDKQTTRRKVIAEKILKRNEGEYNEDSKQITERLKNDIH